ncbi:hypothetical protein HYH02_009260 [Chlamydomonas schloesseri]|uniref:Protein cereblon n=1 Tax=Chlamydomonas schloesseri TaxID=2026947 RepID=A0A835TDM4_9CHLO|nr:hypothetical protein HYH02_009260 [Chlamydomonas schloesseri]|eukprot:KAG2443183.1 hypothetical protein HYH02_009260 [Chlamydomonas schloesseri]
MEAAGDAGPVPGQPEPPALAAVEEQRPSNGSSSSSSSEDEGDATAPLRRVPSFDLDADAGGDARARSGGGAGPSGRRRFDPNTAAQHTYLGDVEELSGGGVGLLEEGATYTLPLFALEGVVLLPGASLPLILHSRPDVLKMERALRAGAAAAGGGGGGTSRLIAVTHIHRHARALCLVGCSAEVRRLRRHFPGGEGGGEEARRGAGAAGRADQQQDAVAAAAAAAAAATGGGGGGGYVIALVARGRQRLALDPASLADSFRVRCRVLPEGLAEAPPRQMSSGAAYWAPWALRPFDAPELAAAAQRLCSAVLPQIAGKLGPGAQAAATAGAAAAAGAHSHHAAATCTASSSSSSSSSTAVQQYTYWLGANLPLHDDQRQQLLEARDTAQRLRLLLGWLGRLGALACRECGAQVTSCSSALLMSAEGAGGAFVNAHGYVHDMATFRSVQGQGLRYIGRPETAHSWFPGYAWTIANCAACGEHLGWRFTAVSPGLSPHVFWGLRRTAIMCPELYGSSSRSASRPRRAAAAAAAPQEQQQEQQEQQPAAAAAGVAAGPAAGLMRAAAAAAAAARAAGGGQVDAAAAVVRALLAMDRRERAGGGGGAAAAAAAAGRGGGGGSSSEEEDSEEEGEQESEDESEEEGEEEEDRSSASSDWGDFDTAREAAGGLGLEAGAEVVEGAEVHGDSEGEGEGEGGMDYDGEYWSGDERGAWREQEREEEGEEREGTGTEEEEEAETADEGTEEEEAAPSEGLGGEPAAALAHAAANSQAAAERRAEGM